MSQDEKKGVLPWIQEVSMHTHGFNAYTKDKLQSIFSLSIVFHLNNGNSPNKEVFFCIFEIRQVSSDPP